MTCSSLRAVVIATPLLMLAGCTGYEPHGTLVEPPLEAPDFALQSDSGTVSKSDFEGRLIAMFFGFTECPDVCPDTMVRLRHAIEMLDPDQAEQVQVVLVSVDPERDDPTRVGAYAARFHPRFVGLTGSVDDIREVASGYGIYHQRMPMDDGPGYTVDHTAAVTVLNRRGETVLIWRYGLTPEEMAADLDFLLRRS